MSKTLNDFCELIVDCEHKTAPTQETGYPSIRTPNVGRGRLILDGVNRVSQEVYERWTQRAVPQAEDIILAREAPLGNAAIVPECLYPCLGQRTVLIRPDKNKVNPHYLVYLLLGDEIQGKFQAYGSGATVPHLNMSDIRGLEMPELPPLETQRKIAAVLSAYDDLIENNTRRIKALEEAAQSLYREWFVEFRYPGHENVPLVESELGMIPQGWEVVELQELYKTSSGGTPSRQKPEYYENGYINWLKTKELTADVFILDTEEKITAEGLSKSSAKIFPSYTPIAAMYGATIGQIAILAVESSTNQACCALLPKTEQFNYAYAYLYFKANYEKIIVLGMGAAQQNISQQVIQKFPMLHPSSSTILNFNKNIEPMFQRIKILQQENQLLREARDGLLPRLVSGAVSVEGLDIV